MSTRTFSSLRNKKEYYVSATDEGLGSDVKMES